MLRGNLFRCCWLQSIIKCADSQSSAAHCHLKLKLACNPTTRSWSTMAASTTSWAAVKVVVEPASCLHDEEVSVSVHNLNPGQHVTLEASMTDTRGVTFFSYAHYKADQSGQVDIDTMESLGGSYKGLFPMGLFGSLAPAQEKFRHNRFFKRDVENPNIVKLSVHEGHLMGDELLAQTECDPLASFNHLRHYMAPGVQRIPVRSGNVRGCLFLPPGDGPFPAVVDMFGTAGGLLEYRSAQLASRGIASLALAFFAYEDLPKTLEEFNLSYFEEAVQFLLKHEKVQKPNVGAVGVSKGGDLALSLSTFIPEVTVGVWINGCIANVQSKLNLSNGAIPGLNFSLANIKVIDGVMDCYESVADPRDHPETIIPIERADANFLFIVACGDRNWKSELFADMAVERLEQAGRTNYEIHKYPGAGHLLEPPYSVFCKASYHKMLSASMLWGGTLKPHIEAQVHAWKTMLAFLHKNLQVSKGKL